MITPIAFVDTLALSVLLYREKKLFDAIEDDRREIEVWGKVQDKNWRPLKSAVARVLNHVQAARRATERPALAGIYLEKLMPSATTPWVRDMENADLLERMHLPIVTNPLAIQHCGMVSAHLPVGQLTYTNIAAPCCAINLGDTPRYHLIVDIKKPEPEVAEPVAEE